LDIQSCQAVRGAAVVAVEFARINWKLGEDVVAAMLIAESNLSDRIPQVAVCCCVLLCVDERCCALLCVAVCFCVLLCAAVCCCVLLCVAVCCCVFLIVEGSLSDRISHNVVCSVMQLVALCCSEYDMTACCPFFFAKPLYENRALLPQDTSLFLEGPSQFYHITHLKAFPRYLLYVREWRVSERERVRVYARESARECV